MGIRILTLMQSSPEMPSHLQCVYTLHNSTFKLAQSLDSLSAEGLYAGSGIILIQAIDLLPSSYLMPSHLEVTHLLSPE